jgi:hypothetical protein
VLQGQGTATNGKAGPQKYQTVGNEIHLRHVQPIKVSRMIIPLAAISCGMTGSCQEGRWVFPGEIDAWVRSNVVAYGLRRYARSTLTGVSGLQKLIRIIVPVSRTGCFLTTCHDAQMHLSLRITHINSIIVFFCFHSSLPRVVTVGTCTNLNAHVLNRPAPAGHSMPSTSVAV